MRLSARRASQQWRAPAGQGPKDGSATEQWGHERADELPGSGSVLTWMRGGAADGGSSEVPASNRRVRSGRMTPPRKRGRPGGDAH
jgi:hypothetical protein